MKYLATKKDKKKVIRSIIQGLTLLVLLGLLLNAFFDFKEYRAYDKGIIDNKNKGFIAISYFGVDRDGTNTLISTKRLEEHFEALNINGYITLTQEDVKNYYQNNQTIPGKSMFLMFEDGRTDTAIFSSMLLEKYNFIGTILNYGNNLKEKDPKFLSAKDLQRLEKSTFWELGTNGYRLSYINVFDRYNNYLGELNSAEYVELNQYIGRNYNHYLMDFIRDENSIPKETYDEMKKRILLDYTLMEEVYQEELGYLPRTHVLMHANTGQYGSNDRVSLINEKLINELFAMNFNREGFSLNNKESSIYDLTRMQPQAYWYPNHLLMRIKADTNEDIIFIHGEDNVKKDWDNIHGVAEYRKSSIIITSEPEGKGFIRLNKSNNYQNISLHTTLTGNKLGTQTIYLRADEEMKNYVSIRITNNVLYIEDSGRSVFELDLNKHDEIEFQTIEENTMEALEKEYKLYKKNSKKFKNSTKMEPQKEVIKQDVTSFEEREDKYIPQIQINEIGNRELDIYINNDELSVNIDNKVAVKDLTIYTKDSGSVYLESAWEEYGYSQRNLADDVYDGVFEDLVIRSIDQEGVILYSNKLEGFELITDKISYTWNKIINWFIRNL